MKKNVLVFGLLAGLVITAMMVTSIYFCYNSDDFEGNMVLGYATMLAAFSFIFLGIRNYRNRYLGGTISFWTAFKTGAGIALVASTIYVAVWLVDYYMFVPDFMEKYTAYEMRMAEKAGKTAAELAEKAEEMQSYSEMYKNPVWVVLLTYMEILPIGLIVSLISALILKRKSKEPIIE